MTSVSVLFVAAAICVAGVAGCPKPVPARCPTVNVMPVFDVARYLGRWYEIERSPQVFEPSAACVTATYGTQDNPLYPVSVVNRLLNDATGVYDFIAGGVRKADESGDGKLMVSFPVTPVESDYWVLDTDYDNYALVYSCKALPAGGIYQSVWVLGRLNVLSTSTKRAVDFAFQKNNVDRDLLTATRHDATCNYNLPIIPEPRG